MNKIEEKINEHIRNRYIEEINTFEKDPSKKEELREVKTNFVRFEMTKNRPSR